MKESASRRTASLPSLGVVIPAYNEQEVLSACLDALHQQRSAIDSVVVVNNNSTDETAAVAERYAKKWPAVKVITELQPGVVSARNVGFNSVGCDIIVRVDADTVVCPGWADAYRRFFAGRRNKSIGASTGIAIPYDLPLPRLSELIFRVFILQSNRLLGHDDTLFGTNMALRREAWTAIKYQTCRKAAIMEDMDLAFHLQRHGYRIKVEPAARVSFSARRILTNPWRYFQYSLMWPATYWHHGMRLTAVLTLPFMLLGCVLQALAWPFLRSYDPVRRRLSLRRLFTPQVERVIPKGH